MISEEICFDASVCGLEAFGYGFPRISLAWMNEWIYTVHRITRWDRSENSFMVQWVTIVLSYFGKPMILIGSLNYRTGGSKSYRANQSGRDSGMHARLGRTDQSCL